MDQKTNNTLLVKAVQKRTEVMQKMIDNYTDTDWGEYVALDSVINTLKEEVDFIEELTKQIAEDIAHDIITNNTELQTKLEISNYIINTYGKND